MNKREYNAWIAEIDLADSSQRFSDIAGELIKLPQQSDYIGLYHYLKNRLDEWWSHHEVRTLPHVITNKRSW